MKSFPPFSSLPSNPLFSSFVAFNTLTLLYFPSFFLQLLFSTGILFLCLLRQRNGNPITLQHETETETETEPAIEEDGSSPTRFHGKFDPDPSWLGSFVEWDVSAPLEVIHEACCEGEEEEEAANGAVSGQMLRRYPSLSRYYPETDSDSDSDSGSSSSVEGAFPVMGGFECSPERVSFRWEDEEIYEERDGLIEIELDGDCGKRKVLEETEFHVEEENLIEIDISPAADGW